MLIRNLRLAFRNFMRNRHYTVLNVCGLAVGITACIIIFLIVRFDTGFDKFHAHYNNLYRVVKHSASASGEAYSSTTPYPLAEALRNDLPHLPLVAQLHYESESYLSIGPEKFEVKDVIFADSMFFKTFSFDVLEGNPGRDLGQPGKVFISESLARSHFNGKAMHQTLRLANEIELEVAGIVADPPPTSHIQYSMVVSFPSLTSEFLGGLPLTEWGFSASGFTYFYLPDNIRPSQVEAELAELVTKYMSPEGAARKAFYLQAMRDIHFDQRYISNPTRAVNAKSSDIVVLSVLGLFILLIACINFVNLATALAAKRSKEIGIRKTLGARQGQLTSYFLSETFLLALLSLLVSLAIVQFTLPYANDFLDRDLSLNLFADPWLPIFLAVLLVTVTFFSGLYPAMILSLYQPVKVLKNKIQNPPGSGIALRKVLVVFQFTIVQLLVIGTLIVSDQMEFFRNKSLGFDQQTIVTVPIPDRDKDKLELLRERLKSAPGVQYVTLSLGSPTSGNNLGTTFFLTEKGREEVHRVNVKAVDRYYKDTYQLTMAGGRWFTEAEEEAASRPDDNATYVLVINESAMRKLGFSQPDEVIGKRVTTGLNDITAEVIGVVKDFHVASLHEEIEPVVLISFPHFYYEAGIKLQAGNIASVLSEIEERWTNLFPDDLYLYTFLDQQLAGLYEKDEKTFLLFKIFAAVSIFIGCLGLYGLISFMTTQKVKEVGIRKVLGATPSSIVSLFSSEFVKLIAIAFVIASPVAFYLMRAWLENFTYRTNVSAFTFIAAIGITLLIALTTISIQSFKAAWANPVDSLRNE